MPKEGHPDTVLMQENWKVKDGLVVYFNQYLAKLPKYLNRRRMRPQVPEAPAPRP